MLIRPLTSCPNSVKVGSCRVINISSGIVGNEVIAPLEHITGQSYLVINYS
jgi:hypothetical protein